MQLTEHFYPMLIFLPLAAASLSLWTIVIRVQFQMPLFAPRADALPKESPVLIVTALLLVVIQVTNSAEGSFCKSCNIPCSCSGFLNGATAATSRATGRIDSVNPMIPDKHCDFVFSRCRPMSRRSLRSSGRITIKPIASIAKSVATPARTR